MDPLIHKNPHLQEYKLIQWKLDPVRVTASLGKVSAAISQNLEIKHNASYSYKYINYRNQNQKTLLTCYLQPKDLGKLC